ncbi:unnamed protein product [Camellia sinensis]
MPCSYLSLNLSPPKKLSRLIFSSCFSTHISSLRNAQFNQSPPIVHKLLSFLQEFSHCLFRVMSVHAQIITNSLSSDQFVATRLVKAYSDLGSLESARCVFDQIPQPHVFLCNAMMNGYLRNELYNETLRLFQMMGCHNLEIDSCTCTFALKACTGLSDYESGMGIIRGVAESRMERDRFFGSSVINFLVKFDHIDEAQRVFDGIRHRDVVCWNAMIGGHVQACHFNEAIDLFFEMRGCGNRPTPVTMVSLMKACEGIGNLQLGKCIHGCVLGLGMGKDTLVLTSLLDMYSKMGHTQIAYRVFERMPMKSLVSWNAMISGCVQSGLIHESFELFHRLVNTGGGFDSATTVSLLQGCSQTADLETGKILHGCILRKGLELNLILSTTLVDLYCKCGALDLATSTFNRMKDKNVITWTAMLVGLAQNGLAEAALKLFHQMQEEEVDANFVTLVSLVHSCAHLGSLKKGRSVHAHLIRSGFAFDVVNMTALIDMYAKCGKMNSAERIFENGYVYKDVILWNSMITGYGIHGHGNQAIGVYSRMIEERVKPNQATFVSLLAACSHSGLVDEGINLFNSMETDHNIRPNEKHYACFVDLLGRAGRLEEAEAFIRKMPFEPGGAVLEALLSWCRTPRNINMGVETADRLLQLDAMNPGIYVVLSNIYAEGKRWDAVDHIRGLMRKRGLAKIPGYSLIEIGNQVYTFFAGDDSHPKSGEIYRFIETLRLEVETCGYVPDTSCVLRDVDEQMKVKLLWAHSERLAIAFGILSTPAGSLIRITKNLRVCVDCHSLTKYISKIVKREIIVRDANRFHHFLDGECSCGDYCWTSWFSLMDHLTRDQFSISLCSLDYGKGPKTQSTELLAKSTSWTSKKSHWDSTFFFFPCDQQMFVCDFFTLEWHEVLEALNGTKFNMKIIRRLAHEASQLLTYTKTQRIESTAGLQRALFVPYAYTKEKKKKKGVDIAMLPIAIRLPKHVFRNSAGNLIDGNARTIQRLPLLKRRRMLSVWPV